MEFDHAGIATPDADELADRYETLFGTPVVHEETFEDMWIVFLELGDDGYLELIEPTDGGPIASYLEENGPGIHHVALETDDLVAALAVCRDHDVDLIDEDPRPGAWGHEVAFLHPASTGGILVELVEH